MPSLLGFAEEDPILQIEVDNSRNILYTRSEKGTVSVSFILFCLYVDLLKLIKILISNEKNG